MARWRPAPHLDPSELARSYAAGGAAALSVLTEWEPTVQGRSATIAAASYLAYAALIGDRD